MVREHEGAVDAAELASQIGVHVTTVRFHLDALCDDGAITRTRMNRPGAGRPRTGYLAIEERVDYRTLADVLAMELGQTVQTRARRAQHAGHEWAVRMAASRRAGTGDGGHTPESDDDDALDHAAARTTDAFARMGFGPSWSRRRDRRHRRRRTAAAPRANVNGSFACTPARYGIWPGRIPRWCAECTGGCCRVCWTRQRPRETESRIDRTSRLTSSRSWNPNCVWPGWWRGESGCPKPGAAGAGVWAGVMAAMSG